MNIPWHFPGTRLRALATVRFFKLDESRESSEIGRRQILPAHRCIRARFLCNALRRLERQFEAEVAFGYSADAPAIIANIPWRSFPGGVITTTATFGKSAQTLSDSTIPPVPGISKVAEDRLMPAGTKILSASRALEAWCRGKFAICRAEVGRSSWIYPPREQVCQESLLESPGFPHKNSVMRRFFAKIKHTEARKCLPTMDLSLYGFDTQ